MQGMQDVCDNVYYVIHTILHNTPILNMKQSLIIHIEIHDIGLNRNFKKAFPLTDSLVSKMKLLRNGSLGLPLWLAILARGVLSLRSSVGKRNIRGYVLWSRHYWLGILMHVYEGCIVMYIYEDNCKQIGIQ